MVTGVPGLGIVDDDEDWKDKKTRFKQNKTFERFCLFVKQLPFNDEPTYFESDEEALAMVKKHFPGKHVLYGLNHWKQWRWCATPKDGNMF